MPGTETFADDAMTAIEGLSLLDCMRRSVEIGSLLTLRELISDLGVRGYPPTRYSAFASFCERGSYLERKYGPDCLLDLQHRTVRTLVENGVLSTEELADIRVRQEMLAKDESDAQIARSLRLEGRRL